MAFLEGPYVVEPREAPGPPPAALVVGLGLRAERDVRADGDGGERARVGAPEPAVVANRGVAEANVDDERRRFARRVGPPEGPALRERSDEGRAARDGAEILASARARRAPGQREGRGEAQEEQEESPGKTFLAPQP